MDKWAELRTAYHVAKLGTVSAAAASLGFHRATVNRHIDLLEEEIGARVFIRHARGYTLTEIGEDVLRVARKTEELVTDMAGRARGGATEIEGEIKITTLGPFAPLLIPIIERFRRRHPGCRVALDTSSDLARLEYGEAHVALRAGPKPDHPDYVVTMFREVGFNFFAHDAYLARCGAPKGVESFGDHEFVMPPDLNGAAPFWPWVRDNVPPDRIVLTMRQSAAMYDAVRAGLGIGILPEFEATGDDALHPIMKPEADWRGPVWLVTHMDLHRTEKVQALLHCLRAKDAADF
ncbi:MAG: LysR family transcriptional regulator [Pseudomonadota bacterium]